MNYTATCLSQGFELYQLSQRMQLKIVGIRASFGAFFEQLLRRKEGQADARTCVYLQKSCLAIGNKGNGECNV